MKVYKVADIINNEIVLCPSQVSKKDDFKYSLICLEKPLWPREDMTWHSDFSMFDINIIGPDDSLDNPLLLSDNRLVYYQDRLFMAERPAKSAAEREEIILRTKKLFYDEQADLASLKAAVANLDAAIEYTRSGPKRDPIPEDVKLLVWARDGGACVKCGSKKELHFDHIIPVAKGGGNVEANIQILCQSCNLKKADKIATP